MRRNSFWLRLCCLIVAAPLVGACAGLNFAGETSARQARTLVASAATAANVPDAVYPLQVGNGGRYLVDQANQPVFWSGDAAWSLIVQGTNSDIDTYLSNRQSHAVNVVLVNLIDHMFGTNAPRNINGDAPFTGTPFITPNEAYFAHADYAVASASQKGIALLLDPLYLGSQCGSEGWCAEIKAASTDDMQTWGQYVGNRYKAFDNIVWVIGGDVDPSPVSSKVTAFVTGLTAADNRHLITGHNTWDEMAVTPWPGAAWLSLNATYTYAPNYQQGQRAYTVAPVMPFFQIESRYENEKSSTTQQMRQEAYWAVLSGGMGYVFGNCPIWVFGAPQSPTFCPSAGTDWRAQLDGPGTVSMTHVRDLFAPRAWPDLEPDWSHTTLIGGYGTFGKADYVTAERTAEGSLVLAYLPTPRTVTVDMTRLSGAATARWYDPSSGSYYAIDGSPFANTGTRQYTPDGNNDAGDGDWALVLEVKTP